MADVSVDELLAIGAKILPAWIPCAERLPEADTRVVVTWKRPYWEEPDIGWVSYHRVHWRLLGNMDCPIGSRHAPTHWMPIPPLPEGP